MVEGTVVRSNTSGDDGRHSVVFLALLAGGSNTQLIHQKALFKHFCSFLLLFGRFSPLLAPPRPYVTDRLLFPRKKKEKLGRDNANTP